jgi:hypothetical protein
MNLTRIALLFLPPFLVFALHVVLSIGFQAYVWMPSLDIPMHVLGGVAIAYTFVGLLELAERSSLLSIEHWSIRWLLVVCLVTTAATVWEFAEFSADRLFRTGSQMGLADTLFDLLLGMLGGAAYALFACRRETPGSAS